MKKISLLTTAKQYCDTNHHRFTPPRQHVLQILADSSKPMGAYDILDQLRNYMNNPKPPTVYRAIDFWYEHGFVHKIESLNAFIICCKGHKHQDTHFLVCDDCDAVEEIHIHKKYAYDLPAGFKPTKTFTETHGICARCAA